MELLEARSGACEIHALAVAVLEAFGIRSRWLSCAKGSIGFGYLEAFVDGRWRVFRLRGQEPALGLSGWELYQRDEPSLCVRTFYPKPDQRLKSWEGSMYPGLFLFANVKHHPDLETLFTTDKGVGRSYDSFNPYDYLFDYERNADNTWIREGAVYDNFLKRQLHISLRRRHMLGEVLNAIDRWLQVEVDLAKTRDRR